MELKKNYLKIALILLIAIIIFIFSKEIFNDWDHFKDGLF